MHYQGINHVDLFKYRSVLTLCTVTQIPGLSLLNFLEIELFRFAIEGFIADRAIQMSFRDGQVQRHAAVELAHKSIQESPLEHLDVDGFRTVNVFLAQFDEQACILVTVHRDMLACLAGLVQAICSRHSYFDPKRQCTRKIAGKQRGLVTVRDATPGKYNTFLILEAIGQQAREQKIRRFGRMLGCPDFEGLIDASIGIRQIDGKYVDSSAESQG